MDATRAAGASPPPSGEEASALTLLPDTALLVGPDGTCTKLTPGGGIPPELEQAVVEQCRRAWRRGFAGDKPQCGDVRLGQDPGAVAEVRMVPTPGGRILAVIRDVTTLRRREATLAEFLNRLAHDLRSPLTSALLMADLLAAPGQQEDREELLAILHDQLQRLQELVGELLVVGRTQTRGVALDPAPTELLPLLRGSIGEASRAATERGVVLESLLPPRLPKVVADPEALRRAVDELLGNALTFTPAGGWARLEAIEELDGVSVRVSDSGSGVPEADLPNLFEPFFRGGNAPQVKPRGAGLGLATVRLVVESLGGRVRAESALGAGSTFSIWLPRAPAQQVT